MDELRRLEYLRSNGSRPARPPEVPVGVGGIRERIDAIDEQLVQLIDERARLALAIQSAKGMDDHGHDVERERQLVQRAMAHSSGVMDTDELEQIIAAVVRASRSMQRRHAQMERAMASASSPTTTSRRSA
ncbi:MAG: chorismate mutase [Chloroflexota bacterium]|nr:chorismate mutase [Chloroflexota bacterium]